MAEKSVPHIAKIRSSPLGEFFLFDFDFSFVEVKYYEFVSSIQSASDQAMNC